MKIMTYWEFESESERMRRFDAYTLAEVLGGTKWEVRMQVFFDMLTIFHNNFDFITMYSKF